MKIPAIVSCGTQRTVLQQTSSVSRFNHTQNRDSFVRTRTTSPGFRGAPWRLNLGALEYSPTISGKEGIEIFEKFKLGNYLDLDGGSNFYLNSITRKQNLAFLNKIVGKAEKREFIDYYKKLTGFPDLWRVSYRIKEQFKSAANKASEILKAKNLYYEQKYYEILDYGYDGISSVAKDKALPGSDLDKAFIILKGAGAVSYDRLYKDEGIVNEFKAELWKNTDQRILSYNHDIDSFPKVYTEQQIANLVHHVDETENVSAFGRAIPPFGILEAFVRVMVSKDNPSPYYNSDYVDTNSYFIKLCKKFPCKGHWKLDSENPSRENIYSFGFILEAMKWGEHFKDYYNFYVNSSEVARNLNVSQIYSLKNSQGYKDKYLQRENLEKNFNHWDIDKQFRFIKELIYFSCNETTGEFPEYFKTDTADKFEKLKSAVGL